MWRLGGGGGGSSSGVLCLGVATSSNVTGPYVPANDPLLCNDDAENPTVGLIDSR